MAALGVAAGGGAAGGGGAVVVEAVDGTAAAVAALVAVAVAAGPVVVVADDADAAAFYTGAKGSTCTPSLNEYSARKARLQRACSSASEYDSDRKLFGSRYRPWSWPSLPKKQRWGRHEEGLRGRRRTVRDKRSLPTVGRALLLFVLLRGGAGLRQDFSRLQGVRACVWEGGFQTAGRYFLGLIVDNNYGFDAVDGYARERLMDRHV